MNGNLLSPFLMVQTSRYAKNLQVGGYVLIAIGLLCLLIGLLFRFGIELIFPAVVSVLVGIGLVVWGMRVNTKETTEIAKKFYEEFENFKAHATTYEIDLEQCEIVSNSWTEECERQVSRNVQGFDEMYYGVNSEKTVTQVNHNLSCLKCVIPCGEGSKTFISQTIDMDPTILRMKLVLQGKTQLYVDNNDNYYFDLEFLYR